MQKVAPRWSVWNACRPGQPPPPSLKLPSVDRLRKPALATPVSCVRPSTVALNKKHPQNFFYYFNKTHYSFTVYRR